MNLFYLIITFCLLQAAAAGDPPKMKDKVDDALKQIQKIQGDLHCECFKTKIVPLPQCDNQEDITRRKAICDGLKSIIEHKDIKSTLPTPLTTISPTASETTTPITAETTATPIESTTPVTPTPTTTPTTTAETTVAPRDSTTPVTTTPTTTAETTVAPRDSTTPVTTTPATTPTASVTSTPLTESTTSVTTTPATTPTASVTSTPLTESTTSVTTTQSTGSSTTVTVTSSTISTTSEIPTTIDDSAKGNASMIGGPDSNNSNSGKLTAVALGCFVLGAIVVVVAKMLYNHFRQKSYALPPEQEMS